MSLNFFVPFSLSLLLIMMIITSSFLFYVSYLISLFPFLFVLFTFPFCLFCLLACLSVECSPHLFLLMHFYVLYFYSFLFLLVSISITKSTQLFFYLSICCFKTFAPLSLFFLFKFFVLIQSSLPFVFFFSFSDTWYFPPTKFMALSDDTMCYKK